MVLALLAALGVFLLFLRWRFRLVVRLVCRPGAWEGSFAFWVWGLRVCALRLPRPPGKRFPRRGGKPGQRRLWRLGWGYARQGRTRRGISYLRRHLRIVRLQWRTRVGLGDASWSALASALLEVAQSGVALAAARARAEEALEVVVVPDYREIGVATSLDCIFALAPAHAIIAGILMGAASLPRSKP